MPSCRPKRRPDTEDLPTHDLDTDAGRKSLRKALGRIDPAEVFVTIGSNPAGRATAIVAAPQSARRPRQAQGADEASVRGAIREILPTVMFSVAMKPSSP